MFARLFAVSFFLIGLTAHADYAIFDTGEIAPKKTYKLTGNTQHLTENGGMNLTARIDAGLTEELGVRGFVGAGKTDVFLGAMAKWMPFPDTDSQPAAGIAAGIHYIKDGDLRDMVVRIEPMISKRIAVGGGAITPYGSVPVSIISRDLDGTDKDEVGTQLVAGAQVQIEKWQNLQFIGELGVELNEAPSYFGVGAVYYWDPGAGFVLQSPPPAPDEPESEPEVDSMPATFED